MRPLLPPVLAQLATIVGVVLVVAGATVTFGPIALMVAGAVLVGVGLFVIDVG